MHLVSPELVTEAHQVVKHAGAGKPTSLVLYRGDEGLW